MKLTGKIDAVNVDFVTGVPKITFTVSASEKADLMQGYDDLKDVELLTIEAKPFRKKRSLNANAYAWKLITEIADAVRASKDEIYLQMLKRYGQSELISVLSNIQIGYYVKYYEQAGESKLNGKTFTHYRVYKGSSEYDSKEMAHFIDCVVQEAKELGIETLTPRELERMKAEWGKR